MKNPESELSKIFLEKLEELTAVHDEQMQSLMAGHTDQQKQQEQFFTQQQLQWEQKVAELTAQVQGLEKQLLNFSESLKPLAKQLTMLTNLSDSLSDS